MSLELKTVGYRFRVSNKTIAFDLVSMTEIPMAESQQIIRSFFDNFKILKSEPISKPEEPKPEVAQPEVKPKLARRIGGSLKNMWGDIEPHLNEEFNHKEYKETLRELGYKYTPKSWDTVPSQQLRKFIEMGRITKIEGMFPPKYKKIQFPRDFVPDPEAEKTLKALKKGAKVIMDSAL